MPEQEVGQVTPEWTQESVEQQAEALQHDDHVVTPEVVAEKPEAKEAPQKDTPEVELVKMKAAVAEERSRRRSEAAKARAYEQQLSQYQQQMAELQQRLQPQPQAPDPAQDPAGAILYTQQQTQQQLLALQQQQYRERQAAAQQQQVAQFVSEVRRQNEEFVREQPDADEGINFLKAARVEEYKAMGMTQADATRRMLADEVALAEWALQNGENPAKVAFDMAKARGYVGPKEKLNMQKEGQGASLPTGAGGRGGGKISLEALAKMPSDEFAKATSGDNWRKLMGG